MITCFVLVKLISVQFIQQRIMLMSIMFTSILLIGETDLEIYQFPQGYLK